MTTFEEHRHPRHGDGRFAVKAHAEADVALDQVQHLAPELMPQLLANISATAASSREGHLGRDLVRRLRVRREITQEEARAELEALNHGGRCAEHAGQDPDSAEVLRCLGCETAKLVQGVIDPGPEPVPVGEPPRAVRVPASAEEAVLEGGVLDDADPFTAEVRAHLGIAQGDPVRVRQVEAFWECEDEAEHRAKACDCEEFTYLEVSDGEDSWDFADLADLEDKAVHRVRPEVVDMALRLRATGTGPARGPALKGYAAIYRHTPCGDPDPVYGKVVACSLRGLESQLLIEHRNGVEEYVDLIRIAAILETDQTSPREGTAG